MTCAARVAADTAENDQAGSQRDAAVGGSFARRTLVGGVLVVGAVLALATVRYAQPCVHWVSVFHGHDR